MTKLTNLSEKELFVAGWIFYLDCPLTNMDMTALWQLPHYGTRKPAHLDYIEVGPMVSSGLLREYAQNNPREPAYELNRENLRNVAFSAVIREASRLSGYDAYSEAVLKDFFKEFCPHFEKRWRWTPITRLRLERKRVELYCEGLSSLPSGYRETEWMDAMPCPFGDGDAWRKPEHAALIRRVAWSERQFIREGCSVFSAEDEKELLKYILAKGLQDGEDVQWAFERIVRDFSSTELREYGAYRLGAFAYWCGRRDWLEALGKVPSLVTTESKAYLEELLAGDVQNASARLVREWGIIKHIQSCFTYRDLPVILLVLSASLVASRGLTIMKKMVNVLLHLDGRIQGGMQLEMDTAFDAQFLLLLVDCRTRTGTRRDNDACFVFERPWSMYRTLLLTMLTSACGLRVLDNDDVAQATIMAECAEAAHKGGYLTIAATLASVCRALFDSDEGARLDEILNRAKDGGGYVFAGEMSAPAANGSHWEQALENLSKALQPAKKPRKAKSAGATGRIFWVLELCRGYVDLQVDAICVAYARRNRGGELGRPAVITDSKLLSGAYDAAMTERDRSIRDLLVQKGVLCGRRKYDCASPRPDSLVVLCGADNLLKRDFGDYYKKPDQELKPVTLTAVESRIVMKVADGGDISLSVPSNALMDTKNFKVVERKNGDLELHYCTDDFVRIAMVINRFSYAGKLTIPPKGVAAFDKIVGGADHELPFAYDGKAKRSEKTRKGLAEPVARLDYDDGELSVRAVVRVARDPELMVDPAVGIAERPIVSANGQREVLTRDFAAETKAVGVIREVLARHDAANCGDNHWTFEGAEDSLDVLQALKAASVAQGFDLQWPEGEKLQVATLSAKSSFSGGETADYWLGLKGDFTLDDGKVLSFIELLRQFDGREGAYVKLSEKRYLKLTAALSRRIEALKGAGVQRGDEWIISPAALPSLEKAARETEADATLPLPEIVRERLATIRAAFAESYETPREFRGQMRPYQAEGYEWLCRLAKCGIGACLADDMGLGKTIQLIALLLHERQSGPSLVVAPASVTFNWRSELQRFAPTIRVATIGQTPGVVEEVERLAKEHDILITSYGVLASREERFGAVNWNVIVLDEAQAIKNHLTKRAKSVKALKAKLRIVATGTPIENRLSELWSIFDFLNPGMLGGETRFARELAPRGEASPRLKRLVKPLILRRLKRDVLTDLPEKEEITLPVVLGDEERHAYEAVRQNAVASLEAADPNNKIAILAELTRLRRFCCHPSLVMPSVGASSKLEALAGLLENLRENKHRALVFSQFVDYLAIVRRLLDERGWTYQYLDGSTPKHEREKGVEAFQGGEGDFFLISLKAGGMGLNLTAANYVILLDPWWNPAVENQAADRAHRIGQRLPVTVYRLICKDTIEEKVVDLHAKKTALAEDVLAEGATSLSAEAMLSLLRG